MTADAMLRYLTLPAVLFAVVYFPTLTKLSMALVSPYAKADVMKRLFAAMIDGFAIIVTVFVYSSSRSAWLLVMGALYLLLRDSVRGQSIGKFFMGLVVIRPETGRPCTLKDSVWRNALLLIPGANVVAIFLESITIVRDPQGQRLGDKVAQTQVVEGLGARDVAAAFQHWWRSFLGGLTPVLRRPGREPAEVELIAPLPWRPVERLNVSAAARITRISSRQWRSA